MTVVNSGDPFYEGLPFSTGQEALELIRDNMTSWVVDTDNIPSSLTMKGETFNGHICHINFAIAANAFQVRIDYTGDNLLSTSLDLEFTPGQSNKLWLTFDGDSGGVVLRNQLSYSGAISFGFLERFNVSDADAWGIFKLDNQILTAIMARGKYSNQLFKVIGSDFDAADDFTNSQLVGGYQGIFDLVVVAHPFFSFLNTSPLNAGYAAHLGQNNDNGRPVIDRIYYVEGRGAPDNYSATGQNPLELFNRGYLKHCGRGFAKRQAGEIILDERGDRWLVVGADGYQAIKVEEGTAPVNVFLPTVFRPSAGVSFSDVSGAIGEIKVTLTSAGWAIEDETNSFILFAGTHRNSTDICYLKFSETSSTRMTIEGSIDSSGTNLSPAIVFDINPGGNLIFETANPEAGVISFNDQGGFWFGYLLPDGTGMNSTPVWGLGLLKDGIQQTYVVVNNQWVSIEDSFRVVTNQLGSFPTINSDRLATASVPQQFYGNNAATNAAFNSQLGQINGATNRHEITFFGIINGRNSLSGYGLVPSGENNAPVLQFLGVVQFAGDGMTSAAAGATQTVGNGTVFRSVGEPGWNCARLS